jgi:hypothetical protein
MAIATRSRRLANQQVTGVDLMIGLEVRSGRHDLVDSLAAIMLQGIIDQLKAIASTTGPCGAATEAREKRSPAASSRRGGPAGSWT